MIQIYIIIVLTIVLIVKLMLIIIDEIKRRKREEESQKIRYEEYLENLRESAHEEFTRLSKLKTKLKKEITINNKHYEEGNKVFFYLRNNAIKNLEGLITNAIILQRYFLDVEEMKLNIGEDLTPNIPIMINELEKFIKESNQNYFALTGQDLIYKQTPITSLLQNINQN